MNMSLIEPSYLFLLALLPLFLLPLSGKRNWGMTLLRMGVAALVILALAQPVLLQRSDETMHVVILDQSRSVDAEARAEGAALARRLVGRSADAAENWLILLGDDESSLNSTGFDVVRRLHGESGSMSEALLAALAAIPEGSGGRISLVSDGQSTDSLWGPAMQAAQARGIQVDVSRLEPQTGPMRVVDIAFLDELRLGQVARARIELGGNLVPGRVDMKLGELELTPVVIDGRSRVVDCEIEAPLAGFHELTMRVGAEGAVFRKGVAIQNAYQLAYLGGRMVDGEDRLEALLGPGFELESPVAGTENLDLRRFDAAILDDRPASELPATWQGELVRAVREDGLGLMLSGGRSAFGPGGYDKTPIAEIAPVEFMQKEEKKDPSTTLAIIIDTSGSMVGNRMTIAKEIARLAMRRLEPHDKVGIVEFYGTKQWAAPIQSAANAIDLQRAINRLGAEGGTVLYPAVEEAYYALKNVDTRFKHVLVLTDAGVETGPYETLLRRMSDDGITVSTVLVGPGRHSEFLVEMADWGGGRYYGAPDRFNLPELMLKKPNTSSLPAYRPGSVEVEAQGTRAWWGRERPTSLPNLDGFVETKIRPGAELLVQTSSTRKPILASWHQGLGRVTAFMTEPVGEGTAGWSNWDDYGRSLGRILARTAAFRRAPYETELERRGFGVEVLARRLDPRADAPVFKTIADDGSASEGRQALEIAPGIFRIRYSIALDERLRLAMTSAAFPGWQKRLLSDPLDLRSPEDAVPAARRFPLEEAARATGGLVLDEAALAAAWPENAASRSYAATALWPLCLILALAAYILDVVWRRWSPAIRVKS